VTFSGDLAAFRAKLATRSKDVFVECVTTVQGSIVFGSPVTAAPGQPRDTSYLAASWQPTFEGPLVALISTNVEYAVPIEEGVIEPHERRAYVRKDGTPVRATSVRGSTITYPSGGGPHSVKLTRAGWPLLVDAAVVKVVK
jgi:hypothetical protein